MPEPVLRVGLAEGVAEATFRLSGPFEVSEPGGPPRAAPADRPLRAVASPRGLRLAGASQGGFGEALAEAPRVRLLPLDPERSSFLLHDVVVGASFHWEHREDLRFRGALSLEGCEGGIACVNEVALEEYLASVISSEMSAACPGELLRAHAVISRSWLLAQLEGRGLAAERPAAGPAAPLPDAAGVVRIRRWYDREDHGRWDVCADDHCQRYHGITRAASPEVARAVRSTRGLTLRHQGRVCDARFSKACGGMTELFSSAWGDRDPPYLRAFPDAPAGGVVFEPPPGEPAGAERFVAARPDVWCNTSDPALLEALLPPIDRATRDFFRWRVELGQEELRALVSRKSGLDPGPIRALRPLARGPSGRLTCLAVEGERLRLEVGKELEIRRLLSPTHLLSSAFVVRAGAGTPVPGRFVLEGAGWGHGVGLCQIGAAVMASRGHDHRAILAHYYRGASPETAY